jgi:NAD(P)H-dependent FMN reductase
VIKTAATLVAGKAGFIIYDGIGSLPHFNDSKEPAQEVIGFRKLLAEADGVLICTPEYAFGVPGVLKNALDWTVSSGELANKPVSVITAATSGEKAHASLLLTLTALSAQVKAECTLLISFIRSKIDTEGNVKDMETIRAINHIMDTFINEIRH